MWRKKQTPAPGAIILRFDPLEMDEEVEKLIEIKRQQQQQQQNTTHTNKMETPSLFIFFFFCRSGHCSSRNSRNNTTMRNREGGMCQVTFVPP
jgi:hypothetical protein